ncbi:hypothetical protein SPRG_04005 [Saprolegnia parasitica CBS 223.65]|uniref:Uncharacterized protein n=1 Tax=Saprolegnia parasitica (strain CBS 223.65) TaxID=695850 RepID=A0A067CLJ6_SAPPC|nr:hypothetical protein SPRG_04005 [Saprolegnia parasitica CBS 223.65]KDO31388.1 hypothetical protein SPRG_04005 [Saprolegnia parasitica CBS 223.65]|eukprot:XP_012197985.1 hypothetical protein SPRG_04005 [Saprolegnia parasitica CBS 223.65]
MTRDTVYLVPELLRKPTGFAPPTTPPTSPQPKDRLRSHLKHRRKNLLNDDDDDGKEGRCHVVYLEGLVVNRCVRQDDEYSFKEGLRKRKSAPLTDDEDDDGDIRMTEDDDDEMEKTKLHRRPAYRGL